MEALKSSGVSYSNTGNVFYSLKNFKLNPTSYTPEVVFSMEKKHLRISGVSQPKNPLLFYSKIHFALDKYRSLGYNNLYVEINLDSLDSASIKCMYDLLRRLNFIHNSKCKVEVLWYTSKNCDHSENVWEFLQSHDLPIKVIYR